MCSTSITGSALVRQGPQQMQSNTLLKAKAKVARDNASLVRPASSGDPSPLIASRPRASFEQILERPRGSQAPEPAAAPRKLRTVAVPLPVPALGARPARFEDEYEVRAVYALGCLLPLPFEVDMGAYCGGGGRWVGKEERFSGLASVL